MEWPRGIHPATEPRPEAARPASSRGWGNRCWHGIHFLALVCLFLWTAAPAKAQLPYGYTIFYDGVGGGAVVQLSPPASTNFSSPNGLAVDLAGNLYIADTGNNRILKVASGATTATPFPISGLTNPSTLSSPNQLAVDSAGNLYIADTNNNRIVEVSPSGSASVLSTGSYTLSSPKGVAVDGSGDVFICDTGHGRTIKIPSGGSAAFLTAASGALAVDTHGNLYVAGPGGSGVFEINTSSQIFDVNFFSETVGTAYQTLYSPVAIAVANNGVIYISDPYAYRIAVIDPQGDNYDFLMGDVLEYWGTSDFAPGAIAVDSKGTVYVVNNSFSPSQIWAFQQGSANFGHVALGGSGTTLTLNFTLSPGFTGSGPADTTVNSIAISTAGAQTSDFTITGDGCTGADGDNNGGCQVNVQFTPTAAGLRRGALVLSFTNTSAYTYLDSGNFTVPLFGIGDAAVAALSPGVASHLNTGSLTFPQAFEPFQTAYDGAGNIYVSDGPNNRVLMIPKGGGNASVVNISGLTLSNPTGLAIDGAGNLFIADSGNSRIVEVTAAGVSLVVDACLIAPSVFTTDQETGGFMTSPPQCSSGELIRAGAQAYNFSNPQSLFIDGSGNLTVDDAGNHALVQLVPDYFFTSDNTLAFSNAFVMATGSLSPGTTSSFAVDINEGLYISDKTNNRIIHVDRFGKTSVVDFSSLSTALTTPNSVALDPMGNLYVMDAGGTSGAQRIVQEIIGGTSNVVTTLPYTGTVTLGGSPNGLAVDNSGNLLVSDFGGTSGTGHMTQINVGQSSQAFPSTAVNASSSPQTTTVTNLGDQALVFSANPIYTSNFSENTSDRNLCTSDTSLTVGISCDVSILFTPQSDGSLSTTINVTDNTQNILSSTQPVSVSGTASGEADRTSTTLTFSPTSAVYGQSVTMTATVTDTTNAGTAPTGSVVFTDALTSAVTQESLNGSGVATLSGSQIVGSHSILAAYGGVTGPFLGSQDTETLVVAKASTSTAVTLTGTTLTATVTAVSPGSGIPTGTVQFKNNGTNMGSPVSLTSGAATMTVTPSSGLFTAVYSGDSNFTSSTSGALTGTTTAVTFSPTSAVYGQSVTVTATVSSNSGTPTGTVTFTDVTTTTTLASNVSLTAGVAATATSALLTESHTIQAVYTPTGSFQSSTGSNTLSVAKASTGAVLGLSGGTLTATITAVAPGAGTPTGSVQFLNNGTMIGSGPLSGGIATLTVTPTAPYSFTTVYSGDSNFSGSTSNAVSSTSIPTTTTVTGSPSSTVCGQPLTFTATVASNSGTPTGTVSFTDLTTAATLASHVNLVSGTAMTTASTLGPGSHNIQAVYSPSGSYLTSNGSRAVTIAKAGTSTALVLSGGTLTATVTAVVPGAGTATGQVQFLNGSTVIGNGTLSGGIATLTVTATPPYSFTAVYSGDANFSGSTSAVVSQSAIPTTTTVTASPSSSVYGQPLTFTATVASNSGTPTGTVTFTDQTTAATLASNVTLVSAFATAAASTLGAANHIIQAIYTPTGSFVTSSNVRTVTVAKASTSTALMLSGSTLTATVTAIAPGAGTPTGTVQFLNGSAAIGNVTLSGGTATLTLTDAPPYSITAVYSGDTNFNTSNSPRVVGYGPGTSTLTLTGSPDPAQLGQPVTFTAIINTQGGPPAAQPGGSVQFSDGATVLGSSSVSGGRATYTTTTLAGGSHIIIATYSGNATFPSASAEMGLMVSAPITMNLTSAPSAPVYGQPVTLTATVGATTIPAGLAPPSGEVTWFLEGGTPFSPNTKLGTATLASGSATLNLSTLPVGHAYIQAQYGGDTMWPATVHQVELTISPAATTTSVSVAISSGQLMLSGTVSPQPPGAGAPTGNIQFVDTLNHNAVVASASVSGGKATAQVAGNVVSTVEGHAIAAAYSGDGNFSPSTSAPLPAITNSAANVSATVAPDEIASLFDIPGLSGAVTGTAPLGTSLGGVSVNITDSTGTTRPALLYAISGATGQINLVVPSGTATGPAVASITLPGGTVTTTAINVVNTAPAVFTANETGQGVYSGQVTYVQADGSQTVVPSANLNDGTNSFTPNSINLGAPGDQVYLVLYATGLRHGSSVTATVNGKAVPVTFFGAQPVNPGLDQVNLGPLPNSLAGAGQVNIVVTVDGQAANTVAATIQ